MYIADLSQFTGISRPTEADGISVVIPVRNAGRTQAVQICIDWIKKQNIRPIEIIVVEEDNIKRLELSDINHIYLTSNEQFNKSKCINCGVANSKYQKICMCDADMILQDNFLSAAHDILRSHDAGHIIKEIYYLNNLPINEIDPSSHRQWTKAASWGCHGGNILLTKEAFAEVGGMDEDFAGHGSEDSEFYLRIKRMLGERFYDNRCMTLLHMPHPTDASCAEKNRKLWQQKEATPLSERINKLQQNLKERWGL